MKRFDWLDGSWRGEAFVVTPGGRRHIVQTERVGSMLNGTVKVIEGLGTADDGSVAFNALAIISYDPDSGAYAFRSYAQGHAGTFVVVAEADRYTWEAPAGGNATMRYTARREKDQWIETGDLVGKGRAPQRMFEMKLTRIGDSSWPAAR